MNNHIYFSDDEELAGDMKDKAKLEDEKTKKEGDFPLDSLYILPTLSKPSNDILVKNNLKIHFDNTPTSYVFVFFQDAFYQV